MNKILFIAFLFPNVSFGQSDSIPRNAQGNYEYTAVVNVDSISAEKLYSNAKLFVVTSFQSGKDVTQLNDDDSKTVAGAGTIEINFKGFYAGVDEFVKFKFIIQCKDGRYKYTINNFQLVALPASPVPLEDEKAIKHYATKNMKEQVFDQVSDKIASMIVQIKNSMASKTSATKDW